MQLVPQLGGQRGRGRDLDQLLPAALEAAVPRVEVGDRTGAVAQHLDLDVAGARQQALEVDRIVTEGRQRLPPALGQRGVELGRIA